MRFLSWSSAGILMVIIHNIKPNPWDSAANFINAFKSDQRKIKSKSSLHCFQGCVKRPGCKFAGFLNFLGTCTLDLSEGNTSTMIKEARSCKVVDAYIQEIPKKLGGACEDHKCGKKMVCVPTKHGGCRCIIDRKKEY